MLNYNTAIVLSGTALLGAAAGLVGCLAVLRRRALMGDTLAHAALPGLCLAFLAFRERSLPILLGGALASGVLGLLVIGGLRRFTRIKEDAALGIVLSVFFGAGIVLSRLVQNHVPGGSKAGLDSFILGKTAGLLVQDVVVLAVLAVVSSAVVLVLYKELRLVAFDSPFAQSQGWPVFLLDFVTMTLVAIVVVAGLPAVGVILMAALLILPAASARFWTERFDHLLLLAVAFGVAIGLVGTLLSASFTALRAGPTLVLTGTLLFLISLTWGPRRGLVARAVAERRFRRMLERQAFLSGLYDVLEGEAERLRLTADGAELPRRSALAERLPSAPHGAFRTALGNGDLVEEGDTLRLTGTGAARVLTAARNRRLWELFLLEFPDRVDTAEDLAIGHAEDALPAETRDHLVRRLRAQGRWPTWPPAAGPRASDSVVHQDSTASLSHDGSLASGQGGRS